MNAFRFLSCNVVLALLCSIPAFAAKAQLTASDTSPSLGSIVGGSTPTITVSYTAVKPPNNYCNNPNSCTVFPRTVNFSTTNSLGTVIAGSPCIVNGLSSTCSVTVQVNAPAAQDTDVAYGVTLNGADTDPGNHAIEMVPSGGVPISFTVLAKSEVKPDPIKTNLVLTDACAKLHEPNGQQVTATLTNAVTNVGVPDLDVIFSLGSQQFSGKTDANGVATAVIPVAGLTVGDFLIDAVFQGTPEYSGSNDSAYLGIQYVFQGFMPPMNADGTSVFKTGRVIPFKIRLLDALGVGNISTAIPEIGMFQFTAGQVGTDAESAVTGTADYTGFMRYSPTDDQYIYNWDLTTTENGSYNVFVDLQDSSKACNAWRTPTYGALLTVSKKK